MKEYIIQLTKGKEAILTIPSDCTVSDIKILLKEIPIEITKVCKHEDTVWFKGEKTAYCKGCGKLMN